MNKKTAKALEDSIAHWERMREADGKPNELPDGEDCALCSMFVSQSYNYSCDGCPVKTRTGLDGCEGSPFEDADFAFSVWMNENFPATGPERAKWRREAKKMINFLKSLREKS